MTPSGDVPPRPPAAPRTAAPPADVPVPSELQRRPSGRVWRVLVAGEADASVAVPDPKGHRGPTIA